MRSSDGTSPALTGFVVKIFPSFSRLAVLGFAAVGPASAAETDRSRVDPITRALDAALKAAQAEQADLTGRVDDALARAAVLVGTSPDEFVSREDTDNRRLRSLEAQAANGERRLKELATQIGHLKFLKAALFTRLLDSEPAEPQSYRVNP